MDTPRYVRSPHRGDISKELRSFAEEFPHERGPILDFVIEVAASVPPRASVLDLGAGDSPYRELFAHARYVTTDWEESVHAGAKQADVIAPADSLPLPDATFDLVLCTQVLEHVPEPGLVLAECVRVLAPGGRLAITVPLLWELHELPHDYYRYTEPGLRHLLEKAGFVELEIRPRSDGFSAVAQLLLNLAGLIGDPPDGSGEGRGSLGPLFAQLAHELARLAPLDTRLLMPLGYCALARKPGAESRRP